ncbi:MAG: flavin reductase family protein [Marinicellaceae bacterium]
MNFDTSVISSLEKYRLLVGGVTPRPIAWISSQSKSGINNLAPYSFFTVASCNPPVLLYTQVTQSSGIDKDTLQNIVETGQCVVNIVSAELLSKMNQTSASLAAGESEFDFANIDTVCSHQVKPLSVKDAPVRYECTLREIQEIGDNAVGGTMVLLDVQSIFVNEDLYDEGLINQKSINSVGKMGADFYSLTTHLKEIHRP